MSLLNRFVSQVEFQSYDDFKQNFKIIVPENFNFAFDVVDVYAKEDPAPNLQGLENPER